MLWLIALFAATNAPVSVGKLDWDSLPLMRPRGTIDGLKIIEAFRTIVRSKSCDLKGATGDDFKKIRVRYAALLKSDGQVERIVVEDVGCRPLEKLTAAIALRLTIKVDPLGSDRTQWYSSAVRFDGVS